MTGGDGLFGPDEEEDSLRPSKLDRGIPPLACSISLGGPGVLGVLGALEPDAVPGVDTSDAPDGLGVVMLDG